MEHSPRSGWIMLLLTACGPQPDAATPADTGPNFIRVTVAGKAVTDSAHSAGGSWVDFDADGDLDLFVAAMGNNRLFQNSGTGQFTRITMGSLARDTSTTLRATWADFDNDGILDAYVAQSDRGQAPKPDVLYRGLGPPDYDFESFPLPPNSTVTTGSSWVDYDNDGDVDVYAPGRATIDVVYRNGGAGFTSVRDMSFMVENPDLNLIESWIDYDHDGDQDLYKVFRRGPNRLYQNQLIEAGEATFKEVQGTALTSEGAAWDIAPAWGDYDNDGDLDLFLSVLDGPNRLFRNEGNGDFAAVFGTPLTADSAGAVFGAWGDYDNDGDLDLFAPRTAARLYRNEGGGRFTIPGSEEVGDAAGLAMLNPQAGEWGDYDGDGDLDFFLANFALPPRPSGEPQPDILLQNDGGSDNNWIVVQLVGTTSNAAGVGALARAWATIERRPVGQTRAVEAGPTGNDFQRDLRIHFGLGQAVEVDSLIVEWPSGGRQVVGPLSANQIHQVTETPP